MTVIVDVSGQETNILCARAAMLVSIAVFKRKCKMEFLGFPAAKEKAFRILPGDL